MHKEDVIVSFGIIGVYARSGSDGDVVPNCASDSITTVCVANIDKDLHSSQIIYTLYFFPYSVHLNLSALNLSSLTVL
jgi:hypothetical protein